MGWTRQALAAACAVLMVLPGGILAAPESPGKPAPGLEIHKALPKEPIFVSAMRLGDPAGTFDEMMKTLETIAGAEASVSVSKELAELNAEIGFSIRDDLVALVGPDVAFVADLPPLDMAMAAMTPVGGGAGPGILLGKIGLIAQTSDGKRLGGSIKALFEHWGAGIEEPESGLFVARFKEKAGADAGDQGEVEGDEEEGGMAPAVPTIEIFFAQKAGRFALSFSKSWAQTALGGWPEGERLGDGADFARISGHLDAAPSALTYVNLPRIKALIEGSQMIKGLLASQPDGVPAYTWLMGSDMFDLGAGSTAIEMDGGTRTTGFGPDWLSGGAAMMGIVAAIAIPNLLGAIDRGKQKRTMADMRSIATALEAFAVDHDKYPGPTKGLVPIGTIAKDLMPAYIRALPLNDGWGNPILYWSDASHYRIVSPGKDGELEREWLGPLEEITTADDAQDIVYADGAFAVHPPMGD